MFTKYGSEDAVRKCCVCGAALTDGGETTTCIGCGGKGLPKADQGDKKDVSASDEQG
jgi:hypothetical protein